MCSSWSVSPSEYVAGSATAGLPVGLLFDSHLRCTRSSSCNQADSTPGGEHPRIWETASSPMQAGQRLCSAFIRKQELLLSFWYQGLVTKAFLNITRISKHCDHL